MPVSCWNKFQLWRLAFFSIPFVIRQIDEMLLGYVCDCNSTYVFYGNDYAKVFLEAFHYTNDTCERALGYLDVLAGLTGILHVVEEDDILIGIADNCLYILHLLFGDMDYFQALVVIFVIIMVHEVADAFIFLPLGL